jgi:hypothetical protein
MFGNKYQELTTANVPCERNKIKGLAHLGLVVLAADFNSSLKIAKLRLELKHSIKAVVPCICALRYHAV